jgi:uncharacterized protein YjiS (DUF1127 family)
MLTLVQTQQPSRATLWRDKVIRLCQRTKHQARIGRSRTRQLDALSRLDDRLLADIGFTREQQILACSKLFWWLP